ncbi:MFS transporter [Reyranella massiliensis]|uniref:MFS transporter n=1 Tax=Reyranella massiliensis TaxID=445220 RepID=UPI00030FCAE6|nr:MFS transporter [Reyranella massiliensis]
MASIVVLLAVFVMTLGNVTIHATVGLFGRSIGLSEFQVGVIIASSALLFVLTSLYWGRSADERGRRPVILWGLAGAAVSLLLFGTLFTLKRGDTDVLVAFLALLGARTIYGLLCGGVQPAATAYMADITNHCDRAAGVAMVGAAFGLGTMVGPVLVALLVGYGFAVAPLVACFLTVLTAIIVVALLREVPPTAAMSTSSPTASTGRITPYLALAFVFHFAFAGLQATNAFYIQDTLKVDTIEAVQRATLVSLAFATSSFAFQVFAVRLLKWSPSMLLSAGFVVCGGASVACLLVPDFSWLMLSFGVMGIGFAASQSGLTAGASLASNGNRQGRVAGQLQAAVSAAWIIGPLAGAALYEVSMSGPLMLTAAAMALGLFALFAVTVPRAA